MAFQRCKAAFRVRRRPFGSSRLEGQHRPTAPLESRISPSLGAWAVAKRPDVTTAGPVSQVSLSLSLSLSPSDPEPRFRHAEGVFRSLRESEANSPVRNLFRSPYFKRRARNRRASRLRVNAPATWPGRSRFAARVRAFAAGGCVRGGLSWWVSAVAWPSAWPTVAGLPVDCLSAHRETPRTERSLVHGSRDRNARTHKQPRRFGRNPDGAEGAEGRSLG